MKLAPFILLLALAALVTGCNVLTITIPNSEAPLADAPPSIPTLLPVTARPTEVRYTASLPDYGLAPEIANDVWLNTAIPLRLADLRGSVVLVDFWTYGCYNCQNVIPSLRGWHNQYSAEGLVVIGVHYPEFEWEADLQNLRAAIVRLDVPYAVVQDNDAVIWRAYNNRYWPTIQDLLAETYP